jgi:hypothetical protein
VEWRPVQPLSFVGSYDFQLSRSISGEFTSLDRNAHLFGLASYYQFDVPATAGFRCTYGATYYLESVQNDNQSWNFGPVLYFDPTDPRPN